jgi:pimeloyl-ACP methyl ester carboxylesterase
MLDWPRVETVDFRCPTLWLVGSEDRHAVASAKEFESSIPHSMVQVQIIEGLDHNQLFDEIERVFPTILTFTQFRTLGAQRE